MPRDWPLVNCPPLTRCLDPPTPSSPKQGIPGILYHCKGQAPTMQMVLFLSMVLCSVWFCENYSKLKWPFNCLIQESNPGEYKSTVAREYQVSHAFIDKVFDDKGSSLRQGFAPICNQKQQWEGKRFCLVCYLCYLLAFRLRGRVFLINAHGQKWRRVVIELVECIYFLPSNLIAGSEPNWDCFEFSRD